MGPNNDDAEVLCQQCQQRTVIAECRWVRIWQTTNLIMTIFFLLAAYVQLNDPDPYLWIPVYSLPAVITLSICFKPNLAVELWWRHFVLVDLGLTCGLGVYQVMLLVQLQWLEPSYGNPLQHEVGREMVGVLIIILWLAICLRITPSEKQSVSDQTVRMLLPVTVVLGLFPILFWSLCFVNDWHTKLSHCKDMFG